MQALGTIRPLMSANAAQKLALAAGVAVGSWLMPAPASAQTPTCASIENCFCAPAGSDVGIYLGRVVGGNQVEIEEIIVATPVGSDPSLIVVQGLAEPAGTRVIVTDSNRGWLVQNPSGGFRCASGLPGATLQISRRDADELMTATSCFSALANVTISGVYPDCTDTGAGGFACAAAPTTMATPSPDAAWLLVLGAVALSRRRRLSV